MPGATAERGLGFTGAKAKRPAGTRCGRQGPGWGRQDPVGVSGTRWSVRGQVGEAGARWGGWWESGGEGRGQVGGQGPGGRVESGRGQGSGGGDSHLNSLEDSGKARDEPWGGTRKWTFNTGHPWLRAGGGSGGC